MWTKFAYMQRDVPISGDDACMHKALILWGHDVYVQRTKPIWRINAFTRTNPMGGHDACTKGPMWTSGSCMFCMKN